MNNKCHGDCQRKDFDKEHDVRRSMYNSYQLGYYRCGECELFIKGLTHCPCCNRFLRRRPKSAKWKAIVDKMNNVGRY